MNQQPTTDSNSSELGGRSDRGETLVSVITSMVIIGLVMPAVLHMIYITAKVAAIQPTPDPSIAAAAQLQTIFAELDPVRVCATPAGTGRRDQCQTLNPAAGASLVAPPADALAVDPLTVCWLTRPDNPDTAVVEAGLKVQCLMLRNDNRDDPFAPTARTVAGADRHLSLVDPLGGDELVVRTYHTVAPPGGTSTDPADYLLPTAGAQAWPARAVYLDAEWWCLRWRHPKDDTTDAAIVGRWLGTCPCPADTFEQIPLPATAAAITDPDNDSLTVAWAQPPDWADTDGALASGASLDDGDPYNGVAALAGRPAAANGSRPGSPTAPPTPTTATTPPPRGRYPGRRSSRPNPTR